MALVVALVFKRRSTDALTGTVRYADGRRVNLANFGRHASLGTAAKIPVTGADVAAKHADVFSADGSDWLRPIDGDVWLQRRGLSQLVRQPIQLTDGDIIKVGGNALKYQNLAAGRPATTRKATPSWMR